MTRAAEDITNWTE